MLSLKLYQIKRRSNLIELAFSDIHFLSFLSFYKQLVKLKSKRGLYNIELALKGCYPSIAPFKLDEIVNYISKKEI